MRLCGVSGAIALQEPAEQVNRRKLKLLQHGGERKQHNVPMMCKRRLLMNH